jgi:hypothetical protein
LFKAGIRARSIAAEQKTPILNTRIGAAFLHGPLQILGY